MTMIQHCPDKGQLRAYSLGTLEPETAIALEGHLTDCSDCQKDFELQEGLDDPLVAELRDARSAPTSTPEPHVNRIVEALRRKDFATSPHRHERKPASGSQPDAASAGTKGQSTGPRPAGDFPVSDEDVREALRAAGVLSGDELNAALEEFRNRKKERDALSFTRWLVERGRLTRFQARELCHGRAAGLLLGDYVVVDEIGRGGMGNVYRAHHVRMGRDAAVKVLAAHLFERPGSLERFHREVRAIAQVSDRNVVAAYDAREHDGTHYLVMEYVDGVTLAQLLSSRGPLDSRTAANCIRQAAQGLAAAHARGIIHRDVKPSNLLVSRDGTVKVSDLGLARFVTPSESDPDLTETGQILGTLDYISPEQAQNLGHADERSDVYSLGWTLFHLLTGEAPFAGKTRVEKLLAHREDPAPSLQEKCEGVPEELDRLFARMVEKRPEDRPQTMAEVVEALDRMPCDVTTPQPPRYLPSPDEPELESFFSELEVETREALEEQKRRRAVAARGARRRKLVKATMVAVAMAVLLGAYAIVVRAKTSKGEITINLADDRARELGIRVHQGEEVVAKLDADNGWSVELPKGTYSLEIESGGESFRLDKATIQVDPDSKRPVEVKLRPEVRTKRVVVPLPEDAGEKLYGEITRIPIGGSVREMHLSPDKKTAYVRDQYSVIHVVDLEAFEVSRRINEDRLPIYYSGISPNGKWLATSRAGHKGIYVWELETGKPTGHIGLPVSAQFVEFLPDNKTLVASTSPPGTAVPLPLEGENGEFYRSLMKFDVETRRPLEPFMEEVRGRFPAIAVSPDGKLVAYANSEHETIVHDLKSGEIQHRFSDHTGVVNQLRFSADGKRLYSSGFDLLLVGRDLETGLEFFRYALPSHLRGFDFNADESVFLFPGRPFVRHLDRRRLGSGIRRANRDSHELITLRGHTRPVRTVRFLADNRLAISGGADGVLRIWKLPPEANEERGR